MVGGRLARRIGRIGRVGGALGKKPGAFVRAEDFISRDVKQSELRSLKPIRRLVETERFLEEGKSADNIGVNKFIRPLNRTIDVTLGRKIHDGLRLILVEQPPQYRAIADIRHLERVARVSDCLGNRLEIGRIGELVDVDDKGAE
jgi:hypothetical protein